MIEYEVVKGRKQRGSRALTREIVDVVDIFVLNHADTPRLTELRTCFHVWGSERFHLRGTRKTFPANSYS